MDTKKTAEEAGIDPQKVDFTLDENELKKVSGGQATSCGEVGFANKNCTKTGFITPCTEIGILNPNCTKVGL